MIIKYALRLYLIFISISVFQFARDSVIYQPRNTFINIRYTITYSVIQINYLLSNNNIIVWMWNITLRIGRHYLVTFGMKS